MSVKRNGQDERGAALVEFAIGAAIFMTVTFGVLQFGVLLWTHNALTDAVRRGARYAINQCDPADGSCTNSSTSVDRTKNVVVFGTPNPAAGAQPVVKGLTTSNVQVSYSGFGVNAGRVTVSVVNYNFSFVVAMFGTTLPMPSYQTTLTGENAGYVPPNL
ncbi:MAG TPA: TadE/TadG family type IV pilus assembly protein [Pyrinomonadaceae bacterium]|nr:TadE/TadG family type IV pilus assembly protein [Pyrinomonadaceae bacterium]